MVDLGGVLGVEAPPLKCISSCSWPIAYVAMLEIKVMYTHCLVTLIWHCKLFHTAVLQTVYF